MASIVVWVGGRALPSILPVSVAGLDWLSTNFGVRGTQKCPAGALYKLIGLQPFIYISQ